MNLLLFQGSSEIKNGMLNVKKLNMRKLEFKQEIQASAQKVYEQCWG